MELFYLGIPNLKIAQHTFKCGRLRFYHMKNWKYISLGG